MTAFMTPRTVRLKVGYTLRNLLTGAELPGQETEVTLRAVGEVPAGQVWRAVNRAIQADGEFSATAVVVLGELPAEPPAGVDALAPPDDDTPAASADGYGSPPPAAPDLVALFRAARARRWHTNARLAPTEDYLDGHQGRVARLLLALHPSPTLRLIGAALIHDDGEHVVGDLPGPSKSALPDELRAAFEDAEVAALEGVWGALPELTPQEARWLTFADRLDAAMWCAWHRPGDLGREDWRATLAWLDGRAVALGAVIGVRGMLRRLAEEG